MQEQELEDIILEKAKSFDFNGKRQVPRDDLKPHISLPYTADIIIVYPIAFGIEVKIHDDKIGYWVKAHKQITTKYMNQCFLTQTIDKWIFAYATRRPLFTYRFNPWKQKTVAETIDRTVIHFFLHYDIFLWENPQYNPYIVDGYDGAQYHVTSLLDICNSEKLGYSTEDFLKDSGERRTIQEKEVDPKQEKSMSLSEYM